MRTLITLILLGLNGIVCADNALVVIQNAWIREAPPQVTMLAAYMQIENVSDKTMVLQKISSDDFASIEIHNTVLERGLARMVPQPQLAIPAHQSVTLAPGGLHMMLMNPTHPLTVGDKVAITLYFENDITYTVNTEVKRAVDQTLHTH